MPILAGEKVTAARLNRMQPVTYTATASADLNGPQTSGAITGATLDATTTTANAEAHVTAFFDFDHGASAATVCTGELFLEGVKQPGEAVYQQGTGVATDRMTPGRTWLLTLGAADTYTFDLRATLPASITVHTTNTTLVVVIYEVV